MRPHHKQKTTFSTSFQHLFHGLRCDNLHFISSPVSVFETIFVFCCCFDFLTFLISGTSSYKANSLVSDFNLPDFSFLQNELQMSELFLLKVPWAPPLDSFELWMALATRDSNCFLDGNWTKVDISLAGKVVFLTILWLKFPLVCRVPSSGKVVSLMWFLISCPCFNKRLIYRVSPTRMKPIRHTKAKSSLQQDQYGQQE